MISVVVADDEALVRRALTVFLQDDSGINVIGDVADGREAVRAAATLQPDVMIMDLQMPVMDGIAATAEISAAWPSVRVLAVTTFGQRDLIVSALRAGASGYLLKDSEPAAIAAAVRAVHQGSAVLSPQVTEALLAASSRGGHPEPVALASHERLSERERDVVTLLARGASNSEMATTLHISEGTVKSHMSSIMTKWGVRDRVQVLVRAARNGLVDLGE